MKNFILLICYLLPFVTVAQSDWNQIPQTSFPQTQITDFLVNNDTLIIYGDGFNNDIEWKQGLIFARLDSNGTIINQTFLLDSLGDKLAVSDNWGKIISTSDGGYAATAATVQRESAFLIKLNHELEVEFIKEYPDTINLSNFDYQIKEVKGGYFLYGSIQLPNYKLAGFVRYVDYAGNTYWNKIYSFTSFGTMVTDLDHFTDSTFVFVTLEILAQPNVSQLQKLRSGIYRMDFDGDITATWRSEEAPAIGYLSKVIAMEDQSVITFGLARKSFDATFLWEKVQPTLTRMNTDNNVIWQKNIGRIISSNGVNGFQDFITSEDGNIIGCGKLSVKNGNESSRGHGWLFKFSEDGDSIWSRNFATPFPDYYPNGGFLYGLGALSSGNIMAGGTAEDGQNRYCWIVKLTQDGCMDTLFCQTSSLQDIPMTKEQIKIYPNPTTDHLYIEGSGQEVSIFDLLGKKVLEQKMDATTAKISLPKLPSGTYHVVVRTAQQQIVAKRIFIGGGE